MVAEEQNGGRFGPFRPYYGPGYGPGWYGRGGYGGYFPRRFGLGGHGSYGWHGRGHPGYGYFAGFGPGFGYGPGGYGGGFGYYNHPLLLSATNAQAARLRGANAHGLSHALKSAVASDVNHHSDIVFKQTTEFRHKKGHSASHKAAHENALDVNALEKDIEAASALKKAVGGPGFK